MSTILSQEAPTKKLESGEFNFSRNFKSFVNKCLVKDVNKRPKYNILLQDPFILHYKDPETEVDVEAWFKKAMANSSSRSNSRGELTPVSSLSNLTMDSVESESTSTTPTATSNSITSLWFEWLWKAFYRNLLYTYISNLHFNLYFIVTYIRFYLLYFYWQFFCSLIFECIIIYNRVFFFSTLLTLTERFILINMLFKQNKINQKML